MLGEKSKDQKEITVDNNLLNSQIARIANNEEKISNSSTPMENEKLQRLA